MNFLTLILAFVVVFLTASTVSGYVLKDGDDKICDLDCGPGYMCYIRCMEIIGCKPACKKDPGNILKKSAMRPMCVEVKYCPKDYHCEDRCGAMGCKGLCIPNEK